jgi:thiamine pyrophosphate-dependent acetolactate synthase large subunit-like protein
MSARTKEMPEPQAALRLLAKARTDEICVLSESTRQDWPPISSRPDLDIAILGSMSKGSSFGLGVALARPDKKVWVLDTDGALLMNLGSLVTIAQMKPANLLHGLRHDGRPANSRRGHRRLQGDRPGGRLSGGLLLR